MDAVELIDSLFARGATVSVNGDQIAITTPHLVTDQDRQQMIAAKPLILAELRTRKLTQALLETYDGCYPIRADDGTVVAVLLADEANNPLWEVPTFTVVEAVKWFSLPKDMQMALAAAKQVFPGSKILNQVG